MIVKEKEKENGKETDKERKKTRKRKRKRKGNRKRKRKEKEEPQSSRRVEDSVAHRRRARVVAAVRTARRTHGVLAFLVCV